MNAVKTEEWMAHSARGFHRIGMVLAIPVMLLAAGLAGREEWLQQTTQDYHASLGTPLRLLGLSVILYAAARVIGRVFEVTSSHVGRDGRRH